MIAHAMDSPPVRDDAARRWDVRRADKLRRLQAVGAHVRGKRVDPAAIVAVLEGLLRPGDRVALEGDNQKQADFLSRALAQVDPARIHDLHLLISTISRPEHLTLFERGIARRVEFSYAGPQSLRVAQLLEDGKLEIGAIYTYVELYARMFVDLTPQVALVCAAQADARRQPLHRRQHRGHAHHRRGHGVPPRHRAGAGQRDRRRAAARRHSRILGRSDRARRPAVRARAALHARSAPHQRAADPDGA